MHPLFLRMCDRFVRASRPRGVSAGGRPRRLPRLFATCEIIIDLSFSSSQDSIDGFSLADSDTRHKEINPTMISGCCTLRLALEQALPCRDNAEAVQEVRPKGLSVLLFGACFR